MIPTLAVWAALALANPTAVDRPRMAEQVRSEFLHAWEGYKSHAWGHDDLKPLSKSHHDWYGKSLLMTPVDAFSTMKLMRLEEQAEEILILLQHHMIESVPGELAEVGPGGEPAGLMSRFKDRNSMSGLGQAESQSQAHSAAADDADAFGSVGGDRHAASFNSRPSPFQA